jgi:hypothetical protein
VGAQPIISKTKKHRIMILIKSSSSAIVISQKVSCRGVLNQVFHSHERHLES